MSEKRPFFKGSDTSFGMFYPTDYFVAVSQAWPRPEPPNNPCVGRATPRTKSTFSTVST